MSARIASQILQKNIPQITSTNIALHSRYRQ